MLPNLIIIGAMKCGTTSLHNYLNLHPQICMSRGKEPEFFIEEKTWHRGATWYQSLFTRSAQILGESSTSYTKYPTFKGVPKRMYSVIPGARLIYIVRNPVQRIVSHYIERYSRRWESRSLEDALADPDDNFYVNCSKYYMQIEQYLDYYPRERIMIIDFDDFRSNKKKVLSDVFAYLEVDSSFDHRELAFLHNPSSGKRRINLLYKLVEPIPVLSRLLNTTSGLFSSPIQKPVLKDSLRKALVDVLHDDISKFRVFTGRDFAGWNFW
ncbi:MAG: sulfotransferase [Nitrospirota bacterium]